MSARRRHRLAVRPLAFEQLEDRRVLYATYDDHWSNSPVTYSYSNLFDFPWYGLPADPAITPQSLRQAIEESMSVWTAVTPLRLEQAADSGPNPGMLDGTSHGGGYDPAGHPQIRWGHHDIDNAGPVLAHARPPGDDGLDGDIHFDVNSITFNNILQVAAHEFGHALGMKHANGDAVDNPPPFPAIMHALNGGGGAWSYSGLGSAYLLADDIAGIQSLYGAGLGYVLNSAGVMTVSGTNGADNFTLSYNGATDQITVSSSYGNFTRARTGISTIQFYGAGGSDVFTVDNVPGVEVNIDGGADRNFLNVRGSEGSDYLQLISLGLGTPDPFDDKTEITGHSLNDFVNLEEIRIDLRGGNDTFDVHGKLAILSYVLGGAGNDTFNVYSTDSPFAELSASLNFGGGDDDDVCNVLGGLISTPIVFFGDGGADRLEFGSGSNIGGRSLSPFGGSVEFRGGGGYDSIWLHDEDSTFAGDYVIAAGYVSFKVSPVNPPRVIDATEFEQVVVGGGYGNDGFLVDAGATADSVLYGGGSGEEVFEFNGGGTNACYGGDGDDRVVVGPALLASGASSVVAQGHGGHDALVFNDQFSLTAATWNINDAGLFVKNRLHLYSDFEEISIVGGLKDDSFTLSGLIRRDISIAGGGGNDQFTLNGFNNRYLDGFATVTRSVTLGGGLGFNTLVVDDRTLAFATTYTLGQTHVRSAHLGVNNGADIDLTGMGSLTVYAANALTTFNIFGSSADIAAGQQTTVYGSDFGDLFNVYPRDAGGAATMLSNIGILGGGGADAIVYDDSASGNGATWVVANPFGAATQNVAVAGGAPVGTAADVESVTVRGSQGADAFNIDSYQNGSALRIEGNGGDDLTVLAGLAANLADYVTSISYFNFDGGDGVDRFYLSNFNNPAAWRYTRATGLVRTERGLVGPPSYFAEFNLTQNTVELVDIVGGALADEFYVLTLEETSSVDLSGVGGADAYVLHSGFTTGGIRGAVRIQDGAGGNTIVVDNRSGPAAVVHVGAGKIGGAPGDTLFGAGGRLEYAGSFTLVSVLLSETGSDEALASPDPTAALDVSGGASAGDQLRVLYEPGKLTGHVPAGPGAGSYFFSQAPPISYHGFESTLAAAFADFDFDGLVNGVDLALWHGGFGVLPAGRGQGDADADGDADGFDFLAWQRQAGAGAPPIDESAVEAALMSPEDEAPPVLDAAALATLPRETPATEADLALAALERDFAWRGWSSRSREATQPCEWRPDFGRRLSRRPPSSEAPPAERPLKPWEGVTRHVVGIDDTA